jgi:hypothetical protein
MLFLPEDTLAGKAQPHLPEIRKDITSDILMGRLAPKAGLDPLVDRYLITKGEYPPFLIDLYLIVDGRKAVVSDVRPFVADDGSIRRVAARDYDLKDITSKLLSVWVTGSQRRDEFVTDMAFAGVVFVAAAMTRFLHIYRLDGVEQITLSLILAQWWGQRVRAPLEEYTKEQALRDMSVYSGLPLTRVADTIITSSITTLIPDLMALVDVIKDKIPSPKLANFNLASFLVTLKPLVFVYRSDVIIPVALEMPPLFAALCHLALTDKSMRKSYLFTAVQNSQTRAKTQLATFQRYMTVHITGE